MLFKSSLMEDSEVVTAGWVSPGENTEAAEHQHWATRDLMWLGHNENACVRKIVHKITFRLYV